ncbi:hypothetical protein WN093_09160 [Gammaproteobacteria bacterium AS21]
MGRWRAPQAPSSKYITQTGFDRLNAELKYLWKDRDQKSQKQFKRPQHRATDQTMLNIPKAKDYCEK